MKACFKKTKFCLFKKKYIKKSQPGSDELEKDRTSNETAPLRQAALRGPPTPTPAPGPLPALSGHMSPLHRKYLLMP